MKRKHVIKRKVDRIAEAVKRAGEWGGDPKLYASTFHVGLATAYRDIKDIKVMLSAVEPVLRNLIAKEAEENERATEDGTDRSSPEWVAPGHDDGTTVYAGYMGRI